MATCRPSEIGGLVLAQELARIARVQRAVVTAASDGVDIVKGRTPVKTGALRDSVHVEVMADGQVSIVADMPYARPVEFGTERMEAREYMGSAVPELERNLDVRLAEAMGRG